jgi:hypothetical protein
MTRVSALLTLLLLNVTSFAQKDVDAVKTTINKLFEGMKKSDSSLIRAAFNQGAILQTIVKTKEGKTVVRSENLDAFITGVTRPHTETYDERITFGTIMVDADLAIAWTPYQFYLGDKFSHCGVNSFQLVRVDGEWKIQYLIDTRRKDNCN